VAAINAVFLGARHCVREGTFFIYFYNFSRAYFSANTILDAFVLIHTKNTHNSASFLMMFLIFKLYPKIMPMPNNTVR
jgi:hypothetical protein